MAEIDNPGGGDCAFYAFAIGLINIIQQEHQKTGNSLTFNQWQNLGFDGASLNELLNIDLYRLFESPGRYSKALLSKLQKSLRVITANTWKEELLNKIVRESQVEGGASIIEGSLIYGKFMELVQAHLKSFPSRRALKEIGKCNEFALSADCVRLAQITAKLIQPHFKNKSFADFQVIENALVKQALLNDVILQNTVNAHSIILAAIDMIAMNGRWGAHSDLNEIAAKFNVNLCISNTLNGSMIAGIPTITLHNKKNVHWTTEVELPVLTPIPVKRVRTVQNDHSDKRLRDASLVDNNNPGPIRKSARIALQQSASSTNSHPSFADKLVFFPNTSFHDESDCNISEESLSESQEWLPVR